MRQPLLFGAILISISSIVSDAETTGTGSTASSSTDSGRAVQTVGSHTSTAVLLTSTFGNGTCPSRTANYITHTLPQQCLRTDRAAANVTQSHGANSTASLDSTVPSQFESGYLEHGSASSKHIYEGKDVNQTASFSDIQDVQAPVDPTSSDGPPSPVSSATSETAALPESETDVDSPLDNANFLSFEEWKRQNLAKLPEQDRDLRIGGDRQRPGINNALDTLGDEGEIELDFSGFGGPTTGPRQHQAAYRDAEGAPSSQSPPTSHTPRSKDAGKTCKERTNYASFDCAATVLKNNPECKSASSVLVENKDSYMLNTCSAQNKFFILELCNDIFIDTVVLANYEFFSSIFRHFRVSVSGRYPVKADKWVDLGTFEARNTREVQAFLIENPQIWARYLRIEFISHYGSEYYCPVSLLRVHGTTMLEEINFQEDGTHGDSAEDEVALEPEVPATPPILQENAISIGEMANETIQAQSQVGETVAQNKAESPEPLVAPPMSSEAPTVSTRDDEFSSSSQNATVSIRDLASTYAANGTCATSFSIPREESAFPSKNSGEPECTSTPKEEVQTSTNTSQPSVGPSRDTVATNGSTVPEMERSKMNVTQVEGVSTVNTTSTTANINDISTSTQLLNTSVSSCAPASSNSSSTNSTRIASSTASAPAPPQPSTQESFFKSIHKRLQQLEANSTLSLQYIEEQSRILRDAFSKVEKRQISATTSFLSNLNETVMQELHGFRQAYDQLWQSTVIELDGQREQYQREMLALSARLTLVADELVWQKRMGIIQSTLLLLCLGLVLFARSGQTGPLEVPLMQQMMNKSSAALSKAGWESPDASPSPENRSPVSLFRRKLWRSVTEPLNGRETDTGTDSRPGSKEGLGTMLDVNVEPPMPPSKVNVNSEGDEGSERENGHFNDDEDDEEETFNPRESRSGPATPTGTRERDAMVADSMDAV